MPWFPQSWCSAHPLHGCSNPTPTQNPLLRTKIESPQWERGPSWPASMLRGQSLQTLLTGNRAQVQGFLASVEKWGSVGTGQHIWWSSLGFGGHSTGKISKESWEQSLCWDSPSRTRVPPTPWERVPCVSSGGFCAQFQYGVTWGQEIQLVSMLGINQKEGKLESMQKKVYLGRGRWQSIRPQGKKGSGIQWLRLLSELLMVGAQVQSLVRELRSQPRKQGDQMRETWWPPPSQGKQTRKHPTPPN